MSYEPNGTQWSVAAFSDEGTLGSFHPTPWEFGPGTMQAAGFWSGTHQLVPGADRTHRCEIAGAGGGGSVDRFEVHFVTDTRFVATKDGAIYRLGKEL